MNENCKYSNTEHFAEVSNTLQMLLKYIKTTQTFITELKISNEKKLKDVSQQRTKDKKFKEKEKVREKKEK